jgi:hypothetical protein
VTTRRAAAAVALAVAAWVVVQQRRQGRDLRDFRRLVDEIRDLDPPPDEVEAFLRDARDDEMDDDDFDRAEERA